MQIQRSIILCLILNLFTMPLSYGALARAARFAPHIARVATSGAASTTVRALTTTRTLSNVTNTPSVGTASSSATPRSWSLLPPPTGVFIIPSHRPQRPVAPLQTTVDFDETKELAHALTKLTVTNPEEEFMRFLLTARRIKDFRQQAPLLRPTQIRMLATGGLAYLKNNINPLTIKDHALQELVKMLRTIDPNKKISPEQAKEICQLACKVKPPMIENGTSLLSIPFFILAMVAFFDEDPLLAVFCILVGTSWLLANDK